MKKIFLFPMKKVELLKMHNPYTYNLLISLENNFIIINKGKDIKWNSFLKFIFKSDIFYFNWIENIGLVKSFAFIFSFIWMKLFGKKIIWTHHNIEPHNKNIKVGKYLIYFMSRFSDCVIMHTKESFKVLDIKPDNKKSLYFPHPLFTNKINEMNKYISTKKFDILIWGSVRKSKGIEDFLLYIEKTNRLDQFKIKIIGKFDDEVYFNYLSKKISNSDIELENAFITESELIILHKETKFILFPYTGKSVFNSGALITSMPRGERIIGPNVGAFKEMAEEGLILTYNTFDDICFYLQGDITDILPEYNNKIHCYAENYTWNKFSDAIKQHLTKQMLR